MEKEQNKIGGIIRLIAFIVILASYIIFKYVFNNSTLIIFFSPLGVALFIASLVIFPISHSDTLIEICKKRKEANPSNIDEQTENKNYETNDDKKQKYPKLRLGIILGIISGVLYFFKDLSEHYFKNATLSLVFLSCFFVFAVTIFFYSEGVFSKEKKQNKEADKN